MQHNISVQQPTGLFFSVYLCVACSDKCVSVACDQDTNHCTPCKDGAWGSDCRKSKYILPKKLN